MLLLFFHCFCFVAWGKTLIVDRRLHYRGVASRGCIYTTQCPCAPVLPHHGLETINTNCFSIFLHSAAYTDGSVQDSAGLGYTSPIVVKVSNISAQGVANHGALCDKNASCQCLLGFSGDDCSIAPPSACGDGIVGDGEECDDGNNNETDGCMSTCKTATTTQCVRDDNNTKVCSTAETWSSTLEGKPLCTSDKQCACRSRPELSSTRRSVRQKDGGAFWKHIITAGCESVLTTGVYLDGGEDCWKGFSDSDINQLNNPSSTTDLMILFGDDNVNAKFRTMYVRLASQDTTEEPRPRPWYTTFSSGVSGTDFNMAQWRWSEKEQWQGPCGHPDQKYQHHWMFFKTKSPYGACEINNYENTVRTEDGAVRGFTNRDGATFFPMEGWNKNIQIYLKVHFAALDDYTVAPHLEEYEDVLVARISKSSTSTWSYSFSGWDNTGHLFGETCVTDASVECKLSTFDEVPVSHGLVLRSESDAFEIVIANPYRDDRTLAQIFKDVPKRDTYAYSRAGQTPADVVLAEINDPTSFGMFGEHTYHAINFRSACGRAPFRPCSRKSGITCTTGSPCIEENDQCPAVAMPNTVGDSYGYVGNNEKCHWSYGAASKVKKEWTSITDGYSGIHWNFHAYYHTNRPETKGRVRLGHWQSGSNSHIATQTSNFGTGLGLDTKGPDDPSTSYVSNPDTYKSRGTTWVAPGESTVGLYVRRKIVQNEDCTERHVSAEAPEENVVLEKVLVAKIGSGEKWMYDFAGWTETGHLFDDGDCTNEDVECKLSAFDDLPVKHGLVLESGDAFRVHVHNPLSNSSKTLREIFGLMATRTTNQSPVTFGTVRVDDPTAFGVVGEKTRHDITFGTFTIKAMMVTASSSDTYALLGGTEARWTGGSEARSDCTGMSNMEHDVCLAWSSHFFYTKGLGADDVVGDVRFGRWGSGSNSHRRVEMANYCTGLGCRTKGPDDPNTGDYVSSAVNYKEQGSTWIAPGKLTTSVYVLREKK